MARREPCRHGPRKAAHEYARLEHSLAGEPIADFQQPMRRDKHLELLRALDAPLFEDMRLKTS